MKAFVVVNPASGSEDGEAVREAINRHFTAARIAFEIHEILEGEEPGEIVRARLRDGFDLVVAAGGDGTVSAVFDGLFVFHYFVEMLIWRFSDPFFRKNLTGLYFAPKVA